MVPPMMPAMMPTMMPGQMLSQMPGVVQIPVPTVSTNGLWITIFEFGISLLFGLLAGFAIITIIATIDTDRAKRLASLKNAPSDLSFDNKGVVKVDNVTPLKDTPGVVGLGSYDELLARYVAEAGSTTAVGNTILADFETKARELASNIGEQTKADNIRNSIGYGLKKILDALSRNADAIADNHHPLWTGTRPRMFEMMFTNSTYGDVSDDVGVPRMTCSGKFGDTQRPGYYVESDNACHSFDDEAKPVSTTDNVMFLGDHTVQWVTSDTKQEGLVRARAGDKDVCVFTRKDTLEDVVSWEKDGTCVGKGENDPWWRLVLTNRRFAPYVPINEFVPDPVTSRKTDELNTVDDETLKTWMKRQEYDTMSLYEQGKRNVCGGYVDGKFVMGYERGGKRCNVVSDDGKPAFLTGKKALFNRVPVDAPTNAPLKGPGGIRACRPLNDKDRVGYEKNGKCAVWNPPTSIVMSDPDSMKGTVDYVSDYELLGPIAVDDDQWQTEDRMNPHGWVRMINDTIPLKTCAGRQGSGEWWFPGYWNETTKTCNWASPDQSFSMLSTSPDVKFPKPSFTGWLSTHVPACVVHTAFGDVIGWERDGKCRYPGVMGEGAALADVGAEETTNFEPLDQSKMRTMTESAGDRPNRTGHFSEKVLVTGDESQCLQYDGVSDCLDGHDAAGIWTWQGSTLRGQRENTCLSGNGTKAFSSPCADDASEQRWKFDDGYVRHELSGLCLKTGFDLGTCDTKWTPLDVIVWKSKKINLFREPTHSAPASSDNATSGLSDQVSGAPIDFQNIPPPPPPGAEEQHQQEQQQQNQEQQQGDEQLYFF
jgi:hypothetical protein